MKNVLKAGPSAHPDVHGKGHSQQNRHHPNEHLLTCPADQIGDWLKKVNAEETGDKGDGYEKGGDDGQNLYDLVHAVVGGGKIRIQCAADKVTQAFILGE